MAALGRPPFGVVVKSEAEYAKRKTLDSLQVRSLARRLARAAALNLHRRRCCSWLASKRRCSLTLCRPRQGRPSEYDQTRMCKRMLSLTRCWSARRGSAAQRSHNTRRNQGARSQRAYLPGLGAELRCRLAHDHQCLHPLQAHRL